MNEATQDLLTALTKELVDRTMMREAAKVFRDTEGREQYEYHRDMCEALTACIEKLKGE